MSVEKSTSSRVLPFCFSQGVNGLVRPNVFNPCPNQIALIWTAVTDHKMYYLQKMATQTFRSWASPRICISLPSRYDDDSSSPEFGSTRHRLRDLSFCS